jgi:hypothetical protein
VGRPVRTLGVGLALPMLSKTNVDIRVAAWLEIDDTNSEQCVRLRNMVISRAIGPIGGKLAPLPSQWNEGYQEMRSSHQSRKIAVAYYTPQYA